MRAYEEVIELIASGTSPESVIAFRASPEARARVAELLAREESGLATAEDRMELDHFAAAEHLMRLAKARARSLLLASSG